MSKVKEALEKYNEFHRKESALKASTRQSRGSQVELLRDSFSSNEGGIVAKPFKWGDRQLEVGETFRPKKEMRGRALEVAKAGYLISKQSWSDSRKRSKLKDKKRAVNNARSELNRERNRMQEAQAQAADAQAALSAAEQAIKHANAGLKMKAEKLLGALEGVELKG